jgi:hypothetical protein
MDFDPEIFASAIEEEIDTLVNRNWAQYKNVTDSGILDEIITTYGLGDQKIEIEEKVKKNFVSKIEEYLKRNPAREVNGASSFLDQSNSDNNINVSIATGGWYETTVLKLRSAGIIFSDIPIASSSDHHSRTEIMKISKARSNDKIGIPCTYFGDAPWDKIACEKLGYNFVLVGSEKIHDQWIQDFTKHKQAMSFIGL